MITYNGFNKGPLPLAFDLGYMETPFTLQQATSSNDILFMERASSQVIATNMFAGDSRSAFGVRSNNDRYWAGIYLTGPTSGANRYRRYDDRQLRPRCLPAAADPRIFGASRRQRGRPAQGAGLPGFGHLSDRPELRVDPTSIIGTGALGSATNPVTGAQVYGVEAAAGWRNLFLQGEFLHVDVDRGSSGNERL